MCELVATEEEVFERDKVYFQVDDDDDKRYDESNDVNWV